MTVLVYSSPYTLTNVTIEATAKNRSYTRVIYVSPANVILGRPCEVNTNQYFVLCDVNAVFWAWEGMEKGRHNRITRWQTHKIVHASVIMMNQQRRSNHIGVTTGWVTVLFYVGWQSQQLWARFRPFKLIHTASGLPGILYHTRMNRSSQPCAWFCPGLRETVNHVTISLLTCLRVRWFDRACNRAKYNDSEMRVGTTSNSMISTVQ